MQPVFLAPIPDYFFSVVQAKFCALLVSPLPLYLATCGKGHSGRVMAGALCELLAAGGPLAGFVAMIAAGAVPFSTQSSSAVRALYLGSGFHNGDWPKLSGPGPPAQCCMPGTM
jgi:hypothetical protein